MADQRQSVGTPLRNRLSRSRSRRFRHTPRHGTVCVRSGNHRCRPSPGLGPDDRQRMAGSHRPRHLLRPCRRQEEGRLHDRRDPHRRIPHGMVGPLAASLPHPHRSDHFPLPPRVSDVLSLHETCPPRCAEDGGQVSPQLHRTLHHRPVETRRLPARRDRHHLRRPLLDAALRAGDVEP